MSGIARVIERVFMPAEAAGLPRTYLWTFAASIAYAASSFVMLMAVTQRLGGYWGGVFSIALAVSQQLITVGYFQVRTYQVSDTHERFSAAEYYGARVVTSGVMLLGGLAWACWGDLSRDKVLAVLLFTVLKAGESFSNVLEGRYQQQGRYDVACRDVFYKTLVPLAGFLAVLLTAKNLFAALATLAGLQLAMTFAIDGVLIRFFGGFGLSFAPRRLATLLSGCTPMFIGSFMMMFINNAPKYALDRFGSETKVAEFSALFMPSFIIAIFAGVVVNPLIGGFSARYNAGDFSGFSALLRNQTIALLGFAALCLAGTYLAGVEVLSFVFGIDLSAHRFSLCLLMAGGAMLAGYHLLQLVLVVIRRQVWGLAGIAAATAVALLATPPLVKAHSIKGAAVGYCLATGTMVLVYIILLACLLPRCMHRAVPENTRHPFIP